MAVDEPRCPHCGRYMYTFGGEVDTGWDRASGEHRRYVIRGHRVPRWVFRLLKGWA